MEEKNQIQITLIEHLKDLFTSCIPDLKVIGLNILNPIIIDKDNDMLVKNVTLEEIQEVLFSMDHFKSLGSDVFNPLFFQKLWDTVKNDLIDSISSFMRGGKLLKEWNCTNITLLKFNNPNTLTILGLSSCATSATIFSQKS